MSVPAGWYDDGDGSGRLRWWDGDQWTNQYRTEEHAVRQEGAVDPEMLWQAVGRPLTGIGAGKYKLTRDFLFFEKGVVSLRAQQVPIAEVHDVDSTQTMQQKMRGVGTISLVVRRAGGVEKVLLEDIHEFREGVQAINAAARAERERLQSRANTQTVNYSGSPMTPAGQASAAPGMTSDDAFAALEKLGRLRDAGVVTPEEFEAKKAELINRI